MKNCIYLLPFILILVILSCTKTYIPEEGVSTELAKHRKDIISDINYNFHFVIPAKIDSSIHGNLNVDFSIPKKNDITLDFRADTSSIHQVFVNTKPIDAIVKNGHIIIPKKFTHVGRNSISIAFTAGNSSLNRREEYLYTLLVPDRASTVFPCFDQPDLKAVFNLTLDIPASWIAVSNGVEDTTIFLTDSSKQIVFKPTKPISTYLFAFSAGVFQKVTHNVEGRFFTMYHRETDAAKLNRNKDILFRLHASSLKWLEEYTGIEYSFGKLDFVLIPGFQYSGMEHPGAIFYRDSRLLLDENPSETQKLQQANLIAHEVAHQWFGNLVTMRWFNDVWLKEVFAGFMADLIVNPQYPDINHRLGFVLSHFPRAYSVDRTSGANPIVQNLDNLLFAGTIYGDIIYHKAPIMMQQLEILMGPEPFRSGVNEYLKKFYMGNADWNDLVEILDNHTNSDLKIWAGNWTLKTGRPIFKSIIHYDQNLKTAKVTVDTIGKTVTPQMNFNLEYLGAHDFQVIKANTGKFPLTLDLNEEFTESTPLFYNSDGLGYGCFIPDSSSFSSIFRDPSVVSSSVARASTLISVHEMFLDGYISTNQYVDFLAMAIRDEEEPQILTFLFNSLQTVWWNFADNTMRNSKAVSMEQLLKDLMKTEKSVDQRRTQLSALVSIFISQATSLELYDAWEKGEYFGVRLNETERTNLAFELMVRMPDKYAKLKEIQRQWISNPDRIARFDFVVPALSPDEVDRLNVFEKLKDPNFRRPEPTALEALKLLNHPLRSDFSIQLIEPSLDLLPEIQRTGDIFFPKGWLDALFSGQSSPEAKNIVNQWIENHPDLSPNLKSKLLQSADLLLRVKEE